MIGKYAPDSVIGMIGGGGGGAVMAGAPAGGGGGGISIAEVAKHNSKSDCWVAWQNDFCHGSPRGLFVLLGQTHRPLKLDVFEETCGPMLISRF